MTTFGTIPQSSALSEASPESLRDLLERDPYKLEPEVLARQVEALRAHRERLARSDKTTTPRAQKAATKKLDAPKAKVDESADDLGF